MARIFQHSLLVYDASHGGVVTRAGYKDAHADFGNGKYNDHHFHYGYLVHASAVAKHLGFDEDGQHHDEDGSLRKVPAIVMDYCNPFGRRKLLEGDVSVAPRSSYFTVSRHKDWYDGHSWASGLFLFTKWEVPGKYLRGGAFLLRRGVVGERDGRSRASGFRSTSPGAGGAFRQALLARF